MDNQEAIRLIRNLPTMCEFTDAYGEPIDSDAYYEAVDMAISALQARPEIVRCKDCEYGKQDEVGRWFCWGLGCQIGDEDGSGYCADAERRTDGV